jgi:heme exporter protein D
MVGSLWLFAGMLVLYVAVRRLGASWQLSAAGAILLPLCPQVLEASRAVTNDAAAGLSGALAVLMLGRILVRRKLGWIIPALVAGFCAATKILNALPMLSLAGVLLVVAVVAWRDQRRDEARKLALIVLGVLGATAVVYGGWILFQSGRGLPGWKTPIAGLSDRPIVGTPVDELFGELFTGLQLLNGYYLPPQLKSTWFDMWVRVLAFLGAAAPVILLAITKKRDVERWLAGAALLGMISYPVLVELQVYASQGSYFPFVTPRYGMSMIPLLLACLVMIAQRRRLGRSMLVGVATGAAVVLAAVSGLLNT